MTTPSDPCSAINYLAELAGEWKAGGTIDPDSGVISRIGVLGSLDPTYRREANMLGRVAFVGLFERTELFPEESDTAEDPDGDVAGFFRLLLENSLADQGAAVQEPRDAGGLKLVGDAGTESSITRAAEMRLLVPLLSARRSAAGAEGSVGTDAVIQWGGFTGTALARCEIGIHADQIVLRMPEGEWLRSALDFVLVIRRKEIVRPAPGSDDTLAVFKVVRASGIDPQHVEFVNRYELEQP